MKTQTYETETKGALLYLQVDNILPHPDNPRRDLGDLTELAASIKENGVLQNLTVVPRLGEITGQHTVWYRCVVGHRRLAAAKIAGLFVVPCIIADMTENQQLITMLMENMQRNDLTTWEQAHGFQMMINLGDSIQSLSDKTGLSESTVRRRVRLMELDHDQFEKAEARGATLKDYMELEKLQDPARKNKVLAAIGTSNFNYELRSAIEDEKKERDKIAWEAMLSTFAKPAVYDHDKYKYYRGSSTSEAPDGFIVPPDKDTTEYFYHIEQYGYVQVFYEKNSNAVSQPQISPEETEQQARTKRQEEVREIARQTRESFVRTYPQTQAKKNAQHILGFLLFNLMAKDQWSKCRPKDFMDSLGMKLPEDFDYYNHLAKPALEMSLERNLLALAWSTRNNKNHESYFGWSGEYMENDHLDRAYIFLQQLGYELSDEERQLMDGTHELYKQPAQKDQEADKQVTSSNYPPKTNSGLLEEE